MRSALTFLLLTTVALGQGGPSAPTSDAAASVPNDPENMHKARALLDKALSALGGSAYLDIKDVKQEGRSYSFHRGEAKGAGVSFTRMRKFWDKDRIDYTAAHQVDFEPFYGVDIPVKTLKTHVSLIYSGDKGYEVTNIGVRSVDEKEDLVPYLRRRHFSIDAILRQWLNEPRVGLFYEGQTVAAQKPVDQVTIMNARNEAVTLYLETDSHLPIKKTFTWRDPADKQRNVEDEIFDNYRPVQGVMTPFDVTRVYNGEMAGQSFLNSASYNQGLADNLFDPQQVPIAPKKH